MVKKHPATKFLYLFLACTILLIIIIAYSWYTQPEPEELNLSQVKITALPSEAQLEQVESANNTKGSPTKEDSISEKTVCLDPGHGGDDPGAMKGKIREREINLIVAKKVEELLSKQGHTVFMTRQTNDEGLSKQDRYSFCNDHNAAILVAVHHNSYRDGSINYTTALYYTDQDQMLAQSISQSVAATLKLKNKGIAWFDNSVLSKSKMPAVFSEAFFLTNSVEYNKLAKKDYSRLEKEAEGIALGIMNYFADPAQFKPSFASEELKIDRTDW